jgi:hypothetical protein
MEEALLARLRSVGAITSQLATVNGRAAINWIERPEELPAITLQDITAGRIYAHDGATGLANPMVQIDCYARTYGAAKLIARAVRDEMEAAATVAGIEFDESFLVASRGMTPDDLGGGIKVFRQSLDFSVWFSPA